MLGELAALPADIGTLAEIRPRRRLRAPRQPRISACCWKTCRIQATAQSILRSAAAAGVTQVYLSRTSVFAWSPKVLRAAQGAHFHLAIYEDVDLIAWSRAFRQAHGAVLATVVQGGQSLFSVPMPPRLALAVGNEGAGLTPELADESDLRVTIPMPGGTESLNRRGGRGDLPCSSACGGGDEGA